MLSRLRKTSQNLISKRKETSFTPSNDRACQNPATLLGMPQEVRDHIYRYVADDTTLNLAPTKVKKNPSPNPLLLVCQQITREFQPILMGRATLVIQVAAYDFSTLIRVIQKHGPAEQRAMCANRDVWATLHIVHSASREERQRFKEWCTFCRDFATTLGDELPCKYEVCFSQRMRPPRPACRYASVEEMKLDLLRGHLRWFSTIHSEASANGTSLDEAQHMYADLSKTARQLEAISVSGA